MEYENSVFDDSRKIFIFDNGKDITDMFSKLVYQRKEWYEPYQNVLVVNEKYWDYFLKGDCSKILEIKSKDEFLIKSGKYEYSYIPSRPGCFELYESPCWLKQDIEEQEPSSLKEDTKTHIDFGDFFCFGIYPAILVSGLILGLLMLFVGIPLKIILGI